MLTFSYSSGVSTTNSRFGPVPSMFIFDGVKCVGTEHSLYDCPFAMKGTCGSYEGAGVICSGRKHQWKSKICFEIKSSNQFTELLEDKTNTKCQIKTRLLTLETRKHVINKDVKIIS